MSNKSELDLNALVGPLDRLVLVNGLQALWRERVQAWNVASNYATSCNLPAPDRSLFGIGEVEIMLRRVGATASL